MHEKQTKSQAKINVFWPHISAFCLTAFLLVFIQIKVDPPMLMVERFLPGGGWIEIFFLSLYAGFITGKMLDPKQSVRWRHRIWLLFSIVFFSQLFIGILGVDQFLMTGKLHVPVPALIIAGPIYRAQRFFMPILFGATLLLSGPAWCSYLCYIGSWDATIARLKRFPSILPHWRQPLRIAILFIVLATSIFLNFVKASPALATGFGLAFGLIGLGIMFFWSRPSGVMTHCVSYCPIGVLATWLGKISPFRLKIASDCDECQACSRVCRYDALNEADIQKRRPGSSCTLCGDCIRSCKNRWIEYRFFQLSPYSARTLFFILIVSLHAVFLGVARI